MIQDAPPAFVRELSAIEDQLAATYRQHNCDGWGALLADEWQVTHLSGEIIKKKEAIETCRTAPEVVQRFEDLSVRDYGTMAIVTAINNVSVANNASPSIRLRFTDVFVRRNNRWIVVMSHATQIR